MKLVAKCSASVSLSYQVHVKVCNPIPLNFTLISSPIEDDQHDIPKAYFVSMKSMYHSCFTAGLEVSNTYFLDLKVSKEAG